MTILYYVYDKKGNKPTYLHNTYKSALEEAKRVAKITQHKIEILAVVAHVEPMTDKGNGQTIGAYFKIGAFFISYYCINIVNTIVNNKNMDKRKHKISKMNKKNCTYRKCRNYRNF